MRRAALLLWAVAGCGGGRPECSALFGGNFADFVSGAAVCPQTVRTASSWELRFDLTATAAAARLRARFELGPTPAPGVVTSTAVPGRWGATSTREPGCVYAAGPEAVPSGSFSLVLDAIDLQGIAHGSLKLVQAAHTLDGFDCGAGDVERVEFDF